MLLVERLLVYSKARWFVGEGCSNNNYYSNTEELGLNYSSIHDEENNNNDDEDSNNNDDEDNNNNCSFILDSQLS